ncbi:MAG: glycosyltransferase family 39 protein, partial [Candidatus Altiarchaeota archaeon]|nr:glycosyltransferase family 39 protein [Candidatus Altiarchaeota archaeon]
LVYWYIPKGFIDVTTGGGGFWMCLDYLELGTLYSNQPYCAQGPTIYYVGYALFKLFGEDNLLYCMWFLVLSTNAVIYFLAMKMLKKDNADHIVIFSILYLITVFRFIFDVTSTFATALMLSGFYCLVYKDNKWKTLAAGSLFAAAVLTKYTTANVILFIYIYYLGRKSISKIKDCTVELRIKKINAAVTELATVSIIPIAGMYLAYLRYPNIFEYTVFGHSDQLRFGIIEGFKLLVSEMNLATFSTITIVVGLAYCLRKRYFNRNTIAYPIVWSSALIYCFFFILQNGDLRIGSHYMLPAMPFLCMSYSVLWKKDLKIFTILFIVTVIYPTVYGLDIYTNPIIDITRPVDSSEHDRQMMEIEYPMRYIPPQSGWTLYEYPRGEESLFVRYNITLDLDKVFIIPSGNRGYPSYEDPLWAPNLRKRINVTYEDNTAYETALTDKEKQVAEDIKAGKYSLIISSPPAWFSTSRITKQAKDYLMKNYCVVYVPNFYYMGYWRSHTALLFRNRDDCQEMLWKTTEYYEENFEKICNISMEAVGVVYTVMEWNGIQLKEGCTNKPPLINRFNHRERMKTTIQDLIIACILCAATYYILKKK